MTRDRAPLFVLLGLNLAVWLLVVVVLAALLA